MGVWREGVSWDGRIPVTCGVRCSSYRLSSHVLLAFWAFAGVVMVTKHRPPTRAPQARSLRPGRGKGTRCSGAASRADPAPRGAPLNPAPRGRGPSPGSGRSRSGCRRTSSRARAPGSTSFRPQSLLRQQLPPPPPPPWPGRWDPTSLPSVPLLHPPPPPPAETSPATRGTGGTRRGRQSSPAHETRPLRARSLPPRSPAPRGDHGLRPRTSIVARPTIVATVRFPVSPPRGLRSRGRSLRPLGPPGGDEELGEGATSHTLRPLGSRPPPSSP